MTRRVLPKNGLLKVLFPIYGLKGGGAERVVVTLTNHLDRSLFEPVLVLLDVDGSYLSQVHPDVRVIRLYKDVQAGRFENQTAAAEETLSSWNRIRLTKVARRYLRERVPSSWVDAYREIANDPTVQDLGEISLLAGKGAKHLIQNVSRLPRMPRIWTRKVISRYWETFFVWRDTVRRWNRLQPHFERLLDKEQPEAIVAHLLLANTVTLHTGADRGTFTVVCMHNTLQDSQTREEYRKSPLWKADTVVAVSHTIGEIFQKKFGKEKVRVIHNPHDLHRILELSKEKVLHPWFVQKDLPVVVGIGRLSRQKNFPLLVEAVCALNREGTVPVRLVIFGEGPDRDRLERLIRKKAQEDRIRLMGWTANPFCYLTRADLFVLCSNWEGLPNTLIEAMACGVPVISTDCDSGPREILQDGACGRLVPRQNAWALQKAMEEILKNQKKAERFRNRGRQRAWEFDIAIQLPRYERLILEGVEKKGKPYPGSLQKQLPSVPRRMGSQGPETGTLSNRQRNPP